MSVSLYDLLDVDPTASADEIRAAWKAAIADLDPTDRRFRAYNDAAAVLLDEDKRAAYDAELAGQQAAGDDATAEPEVEPEVDPVVAPEAEPAPVDVVEPDVEAPPAVAPAPAPAPKANTKAKTTASSGPPMAAIWVAAAAAVVAIGLLVAVLVMPGAVGGESPKEREEQAESAEEAGSLAESAAVEAVPVVLSYDYRTLDANFAEAEAHLTDDFAAERAELFEQEGEPGVTLRDQIVQDKVVVTARVASHGLTRVSDDGDRATVVVYVDQDSQRGKAAPRLLQMWASLSMVAEDGEWLIDDICTEADCE